METKTADCPACNARMHYRLGEFECDECGHRSGSVNGEPERDTLPRRPGSTAGGYAPGKPAAYVDNNVQRGTRQR